MRRLLIISYYYPPCAKSGAHRAIKMVNYLPEYDWEPYVLTTANSRCDRIDNDLVNQVRPVKTFRTKEFYPLRNNNSFLARAWRRIWKSITFIDQHVGWIPFSYKAGKEAIKKYKIQAIFVTGYPFSSFIIGLLLKKSMKLPLFLDYRDPWLSNPGFVSKWNRKIASWLEDICLKSCDLYFGATPAIAKNVGKKYSKIIQNKGRVFTFSYDLSELSNLKTSITINKNKLKILSVGQVYDYKLGDNLVLAIFQLIKERFISAKDFVFESYGDLRLSCSLNKEIEEVVHVNSFIPHREILKKMLKCNGLILPHGSDPLIGLCYPGRMFEFFAVKKPILYIGSRGIASETIQESGIGICANNINEIKTKLKEFITRIRNNDFHHNDEYIKTFEVKNVIKKFVEDINLTFS